MNKVRREDRPEMTTRYEPASPPERSLPGPQHVFTTAELFGEANEIGILHEGATYRLRITRQGKLVLNK